MLSLAATLVAVSACGGPADHASALMQIVPAAAEVAPGDALKFATDPDQPVQWGVDANGGAIDANGLYTAPQTEGTYQISAASLTSRQTTWINVKRNVRVGVTPSTATVAPGGSVTFTAAVTGSVKTVTWSVAEGAAGGTISPDGVYAAPQTSGIYSVVATSTADPTKSARATVTVSAAPQPPPPAPTVAIAVSPQTASVLTGTSLQLTATVTGSTNVAVTWSVAEPGGGTVSGTGLYMAPSTPGTYHVVATSSADPTQSASASVSVSSPTVSTPVIASFTATPSSIVQGASSTLAWAVSGGTSVTIDNGVGPVTGLSSDPVSPTTTTTYTLTATNSAGSATATALVAVSAAPPPPTVTVAVSPQATSSVAGSTVQFSATVTGTTNRSVTWTVTESGGGTVSGTGLYTAPAAAGTYHVVATSDADITKTATAAVTVTAPPPPPPPTSTQVGPDANTTFAMPTDGTWVNVKDYGAVGDGSHDDTTAFAAAINSGKRIFVPACTAFYKITALLPDVTHDIYGDGSMPMIKRVGVTGQTSGANFRVGATTSAITFNGLTIDGGWDGTYTPPGEFQGGIMIYGGANITIQNSIIQNHAGDNVLVWESGTTRANNITIQKCKLSNPYRCNVAVVSAQYVTIRNNTVSKTWGFVVPIDLEPDPTGYDYLNNITITQNYFDVASMGQWQGYQYPPIMFWTPGGNPVSHDFTITNNHGSWLNTTRLVYHGSYLTGTDYLFGADDGNNGGSIPNLSYSANSRGPMP